MRKSRKVRGWSLLEILLVVTVIGVLGALVSTVGFRFIDAARRAEAQSQLRLIVGAMHHYANDHEDQFPAYYWHQSTPRLAEWTFGSQLVGYLYEDVSRRSDGSFPLARKLNNDENVFISATSQQPVTRAPSTGWVNSTWSVHGGILRGAALGDRPRRSSIVRPSELILIGDSAQSVTTGLATTSFSQPNNLWRQALDIPNERLDIPIPVGPDADTAAGHGWLRYRTGGAAAVAMADGSVRLMKPGSVLHRNLVWDR